MHLKKKCSVFPSSKTSCLWFFWEKSFTGNLLVTVRNVSRCRANRILHCYVTKKIYYKSRHNVDQQLSQVIFGYDQHIMTYIKNNLKQKIYFDFKIIHVYCIRLPCIISIPNRYPLNYVIALIHQTYCHFIVEFQ